MLDQIAWTAEDGGVPETDNDRIKRAALAFRRPHLSFGQLSKLANVRASTLRTWVDRKVFNLDADKFREGGKHRRFSNLDAIKILTAQMITNQGVQTSLAANGAEAIAFVCSGCVEQTGHILDIPSVLYLDLSQTHPKMYGEPLGLACVAINAFDLANAIEGLRDGQIPDDTPSTDESGED